MNKSEKIDLDLEIKPLPLLQPAPKKPITNEDVMKKLLEIEKKILALQHD